MPQGLLSVLPLTLVSGLPRWRQMDGSACRLAFHSYARRTRGCISAFKGLPPPQRPRRALQMLPGSAGSALASPALLCLLLFKPASEKTKKLEVSVECLMPLSYSVTISIKGQRISITFL